MIFPRKLICPGLPGLLAFSFLGCGSGSPYVRVSGVVTLNGKPYPGAVVNFQPMGTKENPYPGRGSYGHTNEHGRFTLVVDDRIAGAVVGKHRVRIATPRAMPAGWDPALGTPDGDPKFRPKPRMDPIPPEWNTNSTKEFEVPPGGTDQANFVIVSKTR
jgi:hypothetical protein